MSQTLTFQDFAFGVCDFLIPIDAVAGEGFLHQAFGEKQALGTEVGFDLQQHVFFRRVECDREIGRQGPRCSGPDQHRDRSFPGTIGFDIQRADKCGLVDYRETHIDRG